jgi:imidazole glycerol-phosphate synthase subunit HisH
MKMNEVVVVDYGCGNIQSLERALSRIGVSCIYSSDSKIISDAKKIILPGVGSFATGMRMLKEMNLEDVIKHHVNSSKPLLGICLGMQLLLDYSEEFGSHNGLGIIQGSVTRFTPLDGSKVPHTGWNSIEIPSNHSNDEILDGIPSGKDYYFVHSYKVETKNSLNTIAQTKYGGCYFSSIIRNKNVYGCQFHPEKSGQIGSKFLKNFINIGKKI